MKNEKSSKQKTKIKQLKRKIIIIKRSETWKYTTQSESYSLSSPSDRYCSTNDSKVRVLVYLLLLVKVVILV